MFEPKDMVIGLIIMHALGQVVHVKDLQRNVNLSQILMLTSQTRSYDL